MYRFHDLLPDDIVFCNQYKQIFQCLPILVRTLLLIV